MKTLFLCMITSLIWITILICVGRISGNPIVSKTRMNQRYYERYIDTMEHMGKRFPGFVGLPKEVTTTAEKCRDKPHNFTSYECFVHCNMFDPQNQLTGLRNIFFFKPPMDFSKFDKDSKVRKSPCGQDKLTPSSFMKTEDQCATAMEVFSCSTKDVKGRRLIKQDDEALPKYMTDDEIWVLISNNKKFVDMTDHIFPKFTSDDIFTSGIPSEANYFAIVRPLIAKINETRMREFITKYSSFPNRYFDQPSGIESQAWLTTRVRQAIIGYPYPATVTEVVHKEYPTKSIIARINGSDPVLSQQVVIVGAHLDAINNKGKDRNTPGADDNAAGCIIVLETLTLLVESQFQPKKTLEFHFYAAEEVGLRGSTDIAKDYRAREIVVAGMLNFDIPSFHRPGKDSLALYTDNSHPVLNEFVRQLANKYLNFTLVDSQCGYGCSDYASWHSYGYASAFPAELEDYKFLHTLRDNITIVDFIQLGECVKLSTAFTVEMSRPTV